MKTLLLGSTGQLGTAIETVFDKRGWECVGVSREELEITHPEEVEAIIASVKPEVVINSVALQAIEKCEGHPVEAFQINAVAVSNLAKICEREGIILVQLSTHTVFDGRKDGFYTEDDLPNPVNTYGASKYTGELFAQNLCSKHYIVRLPTMFGRRRAGYLGFVDKLLKWIDEGKHLKMADDKIDSFGYTFDTADVLFNMLKENMPYGIYHLTNEGCGSYYDLAAEVIKILNVEAKLNRAKDSDFPAAGVKPLKTAMKSIKLKPLRKWEEALKFCFKEDGFSVDKSAK